MKVVGCLLSIYTMLPHYSLVGMTPSPTPANQHNSPIPSARVVGQHGHITQPWLMNEDLAFHLTMATGAVT